MPLALVTGATGLVGSHIVERLRSDGWSVRAMVRSPDVARHALPDDVALVAGDVLDAPSFARAAAGCDAVVHAAAHVIARGGWDAYRATNVGGTANAVRAAEQAGARLLHISSVAVYGPTARYDAARRGGRTDESTPLAPLPEHLHYARSKRDSETLVLAAHASGRVWATAVRPDVVYGRRDRQFVPRMARLIERGVIPLIKGGRPILAIVHAANVAEGALLALRNDAAGGKAYNLANDFDVSVREFFELAAEGLGRRARWLPVPLSAAEAAMPVLHRIIRIVTRGRFGDFSSSSLSFITEDNPFSSDLAKRELGWQPYVTPGVGIPDAFRWWKEHAR